MFGTQFLLPLLTATLGALMGQMINPADGLLWGTGAGSAVGIAVVAGVCVLIAVLRRMQ